MDTKYNEYIDFLKKYCDELSSYLGNEREKRLALLSNDFSRLEAMVQAQQAETMKLRGFEQKRVALQSKLGLHDVKAKELLAAIDDKEARALIDGLFTDISRLAESIHEQNKQSLELAKNSQRIIEQVMGGGEAETHNMLYGPENGRRKVFSAGNAFEETI